MLVNIKELVVDRSIWRNLSRCFVTGFFLGISVSAYHLTPQVQENSPQEDGLKKGWGSRLREICSAESSIQEMFLASWQPPSGRLRTSSMRWLGVGGQHRPAKQLASIPYSPRMRAWGGGGPLLDWESECSWRGLVLKENTVCKHNKMFLRRNSSCGFWWRTQMARTKSLSLFYFR